MQDERTSKSGERRYKRLRHCWSMLGDTRLTGELPKCWTPIQVGIQDVYWNPGISTKEPSTINRDRGNLPQIYRSLLKINSCE
jgi:hypothetical protein